MEQKIVTENMTLWDAVRAERNALGDYRGIIADDKHYIAPPTDEWKEYRSTRIAKAGCGTSGRPKGKNKGPSEMLKPLILLVGAIGFEPTTSCSQSRRATKLRYAPSPQRIASRPSAVNLNERVCDAGDPARCEQALYRRSNADVPCR